MTQLSPHANLGKGTGETEDLYPGRMALEVPLLVYSHLYTHSKRYASFGWTLAYTRAHSLASGARTILVPTCSLG